MLLNQRTINGEIEASIRPPQPESVNLITGESITTHSDSFANKRTKLEGSLRVELKSPASQAGALTTELKSLGKS